MFFLPLCILINILLDARYYNITLLHVWNVLLSFKEYWHLFSRELSNLWICLIFLSPISALSWLFWYSFTLGLSFNSTTKVLFFRSLYWMPWVFNKISPICLVVTCVSPSPIASDNCSAYTCLLILRQPGGISFYACED